MTAARLTRNLSLAVFVLSSLLWLWAYYFVHHRSIAYAVGPDSPPGLVRHVRLQGFAHRAYPVLPWVMGGSLAAFALPARREGKTGRGDGDA